LLIVSDLLVAADTRIELDLRKSVMRHFLTLASTPLTLPPRMVQPAAKARLIASTRRTHALASRLARTWIGAIPLTMITAPAYAELSLTARTIEQSVPSVDRSHLQPQKAGRSLPIASWSPLGQAPRVDRSANPRRPEEASPRAFTFCGACRCYRAGTHEKTMRPCVSSKKLKKMKQIQRRKWIVNR